MSDSKAAPAVQDAPPPVETETEGALYKTLKEDLKAELRGELKDDVLPEIRQDIRKEFARGQVNFAVPKAKDAGTFGEWAQCVGQMRASYTSPDVKQKAFNMLKDRYDYDTYEPVRKTLVQGTAGSGGDIVPVEYSSTLFTLDGLNPVFWPRGAFIFDMPSNETKIPSLDYTTTPSAGTSAFGAGFVQQETSEATAPTPTQPGFKQITFTAEKLMSLTYVSNELLDNNNLSTALEQVLTKLIRMETISKVDYYCFNTSPAQNIQGFIGDTATVQVARSNVGEVTLEDLSNMYARILPQLYSSYCWVIHPSVVPQILQLADLAGRIVFLPDRSVVGAPNWQIFGLPVMISDNAALLGQAADVCLVARDIYAIGLNKNIQIAASTDYQFGSDIVTYRCAVRVCGNPLLTSKVLLKDGSYQVGWAITLKATTS